MVKELNCYRNLPTDDPDIIVGMSGSYCYRNLPGVTLTLRFAGQDKSGIL
jgi:hypothetical protein